MHDRPIQWLTMRNRVAGFLDSHRSRVKVYRLCRRVMQDYEDEIGRLKEWHEIVVQLDESCRQIRDMSRAKANEDPNTAEMVKITHLAVLEQSVNLRNVEEDLERNRVEHRLGQSLRPGGDAAGDDPGVAGAGRGLRLRRGGVSRPLEDAGRGVVQGISQVLPVVPPADMGGAGTQVTRWSSRWGSRR